MIKTIASILILASLALGEVGPPLKNADNAKVKDAYLQAIVAQQRYFQRVNIFNAIIDQVIKDEDLPKGTEISVEEDKDGNVAINVVLPPKKAEDPTPKK